MTPLHLTMLLHYYVSSTAYAAHTNEQVVQEYRATLVEWGLIEGEPSSSGYECTAKGRAFVRALLLMPLPEQRWIIPEFTPEELGMNGGDGGSHVPTKRRN